MSMIKTKIVLKVKHWFLISAFGVLMIFAFRAATLTMTIIDFSYLLMYAMLLTVSFPFLYRYRNMELREYAEIGKEWK